MSPVSYQTIKLSKGKHSSPNDGACVMELASMLAGEKFTDRPQSVCPAIGSVLRAYNDAVDNEYRQDLYEYATRVVGTRGSAELERARADRLLEWAQARQARHWHHLIPASLRRFGSGRRPPIDACGTHAVRAIKRQNDETHAQVLALIDELIAMNAQPADPQSPAEAERHLTVVI